jgi:ferredoxin
MTQAPETFQVTIANKAQTIACTAGQTILQAAIAAGIDYPYACATGNCATCISKLEGGTVSLLPRADTALRDAQIRTGLTLACRARPRSDVTVTWLARAAG